MHSRHVLFCDVRFPRLHYGVSCFVLRLLSFRSCAVLFCELPFYDFSLKVKSFPTLLMVAFALHTFIPTPLLEAVQLKIFTL
jgi:hypothetical protein